MSWVQAVKEYAKVTGSFSIPKKDSAEYEEVKKIQEQMKAGTWGAVESKEEVVPKEESVKIHRKPKEVVKKSEPVEVLKEEKKEAVEVAEPVKKPRAKKGEVKVSEPLATSNAHNIKREPLIYDGAEHTRSKRAKDKEPVVVPVTESVTEKKEEKAKRVPRAGSNVIKARRKPEPMSIVNEKVIMDFS